MTTAVGTILSVAGDIITTISGNATLMAFFCVGFVGSVIGVVMRLRG